MHLTCESSLLEDYLCEQEVVDYSHHSIQEAISQHSYEPRGFQPGFVING